MCESRLHGIGENMSKSDGQWWPTNEVRSATGFEDVVYAAMGPALTHRLVDAFDRFLESEETLHPKVRHFFLELRERDGHMPAMLPILAVASVGALIARSPEERNNPRYRSVLENEQLLHVARRTFGHFVEGALDAFGFHEEILAEYLLRHWQPYGRGIWPPPGIAYLRQPPDDIDTESTHSSISSDVSLGDVLGFWRSLRDYPSLVGAHLVQMTDLRRYAEALRDSLENLELDIRECGLSDPERSASELRRAVALVEDALRMVHEAQHIIARHFPT